MLLLVLSGKGKEVQGVQTAVLLHGPIVKDMLVIFSREDWLAVVLIGSCGALNGSCLRRSYHALLARTNSFNN